jgi:hypothetical protein
MPMPTKIMSKVMVKPNFLSIKCQLTYLLVPFLKLAKEPQTIQLPLISLFQPKKFENRFLAAKVDTNHNSKVQAINKGAIVFSEHKSTSLSGMPTKSLKRY